MVQHHGSTFITITSIQTCCMWGPAGAPQAVPAEELQPNWVGATPLAGGSGPLCSQVAAT